MNYKERYEQALQRAREAKENTESAVTVGILEEVFPELRESEDEKIRKALVDALNKNLGNGIEKYGTTFNAALAWLEKQGEQSSLNINRECLKGIKRVQEYQDLSDWEKEFDKIASMYAHNKNQEGYNDSWYVKERAAEMLYYAKKELEKQGGQKPAWSCEDETRLQACLDTLQANSLMGKVDTVMTNWLKSLKNRIKGE